MGVIGKAIDLYRNRHQRKIEKNIKVIKNPKAIREDRTAAIEFFKAMEDLQVAVPALLNRFDYSLEHGILDTRDKEAAMDGIVRFGEEALPLVRDHLYSTSRIAWPIKVLNKLGREEEVVEVLKGALSFEDVSFDAKLVDKNYDILCYLRDYKVPGFEKKLTHFLKDPDERVRFACVEVLIEQETDEIRDDLEPFLADDTADNRRIRKAVAEAFLDRDWRVANPDRIPEGEIIDHVFVTSKGRLERR